jgi:hypothetical protein
VKEGDFSRNHYFSTPLETSVYNNPKSILGFQTCQIKISFRLIFRYNRNKAFKV